jgi:hypothetical protein
MHFSHFLLGLVASASAIDVYFHNTDDCSGAASICTGINPNICCTGGDSLTVAYRGIPTNWHITAQGFSGGGCGSPKYQTGDLNGQNWYCLSDNSRFRYTGSFYSFISRRRAEDNNCTESVKPDTLVLADGVTKYDVVGLDDIKVAELVSTMLYIACICRLQPPSYRSYESLARLLANWFSSFTSLLLLVPELAPKGCLRSSRCGAGKSEARETAVGLAALDCEGLEPSCNLRLLLFCCVKR